MIFDPKEKDDDNKADDEPIFDPSKIIQSDPNKVQQNSIDDYPPSLDDKPDISKSGDWEDYSKGSGSISGLDY
jgi:hypothetical protein